VAEQLGEAVLRVTVDDSAARESLNRLRQEVSRSTRAATGGTGPRGRTAGGARESAQAEFTAYKKLYALEQQINSLAQQGLNIDRLRAQLVQAFAATARGNFGTAKQLTNELGLQLQQERSILSIKQKQDSAAKKLQQSELQVAAAIAKQAAAQKQFEESRSRAARAALAATGPGTTGFAPLSTTPAAQRQQQNALARSAAQERRAETRTSQTASGSGLTRFLREQDALAQAAASTRALAAALERRNASLSRLAETAASQTAGGSGLTRFLRQQDQLAATAARTQGRTAISERRAEIRSLQTAGGGGGGLTSFLRDVRQREEGERRIAAIRKAGYKDAEFAEKTLRSFVEQRAKREGGAAGGLRQRAGGALGSALIGGGFPLLFGQGVGAAAGGLAGGAVGGAIGGQFGFGLSIVGTIVGDAFDEALNKGKTLAAGLSDPIGKFDELRQAGLISSKALEKNISSLIAQGREAEAAAKIQLDLATSYGDTSELTALNNAYDELGRAFSQLSVITAKFVAGPLADFITKLSGTFTAQSTQALLTERLTNAPQAVREEAFAARRAAFKEASQSGTPGGAAITAGNLAALKVLDQRLGKTKEIQQAENLIAVAVERQANLDRLTTKQIQAKVQGYDLLALSIEKQRIETQRLLDLQANPPENADGINRKAALDRLQIEEQINNTLRDRAAVAELDIKQSQLKLGNLRDQKALADSLISAAPGDRERLSVVGQAANAVKVAKRAEEDIRAQIAKAAAVGGDAAAEEVQALANRLNEAIAATSLAYSESALNVKQFDEQAAAAAASERQTTLQAAISDAMTKTQSAADSFKQAANSIVQASSSLRSAREGAFQFLNRSAQAQLLSQAREAYSRVAEFRPLPSNLSDQEVLAAGNAARSVLNAQEQYDNANKELVSSIDSLAEKNWAVNVNVQGGSASAYGDVLNQAVST
jgi:colicin import membrane protein